MLLALALRHPDEVLPRQVREAGRAAAPRQRMAFRHDERELLREKLAGEQAGDAAGELHDAQVGPPRRHRLPDGPRGDGLAHGNLDLGVRLAEPGERGWEQVLPGRREGPEGELPALQPHDGAYRPPRLLLQRQHPLGVVRQRRPGVGQAHRPPLPHEQRRADLPLQVRDLKAERRLRDEALVGCPREVEVPRRRREVAQLKEFHR